MRNVFEEEIKYPEAIDGNLKEVLLGTVDSEDIVLVVEGAIISSRSALQGLQF